MNDRKESIVTLPSYQSEKDCMVHINTDDGKVHVAWTTKEGTIIAYEYIPFNYPSCALITYEDIAEYKGCLRNINTWVYPEFVRTWNEEILGNLQNFIEELGE